MRTLVDTNVLVRAVERRHPLMRTTRLALRTLHARGHDLCVTTQNIAEFWNVSTRPATVRGLGNTILETDRLATRIEALFTLLPDSMEAFVEWRGIVRVYSVQGAQVHDARLAATMKVNGVGQVLTYNGSDFKRFPITILDPSKL